jgi:hypothetical protein
MSKLGGKGGPGQTGGQGIGGAKGQDALLSQLEDCKRKIEYKYYLRKTDANVKIINDKNKWPSECKEKFDFKISKPEPKNFADISSSVNMKKNTVLFTFLGEKGNFPLNI